MFRFEHEEGENVVYWYVTTNIPTRRLQMNTLLVTTSKYLLNIIGVALVEN